MNVLGKFAKGVGDVVLGNDKSAKPLTYSLVEGLRFSADQSVEETTPGLCPLLGPQQVV
jgi:hypothetical protein